MLSGHKGVKLRRVHCLPEFLCRHGNFIFNIKIHLKESFCSIDHTRHLGLLNCMGGTGQRRRISAGFL